MQGLCTILTCCKSARLASLALCPAHGCSYSSAFRSPSFFAHSSSSFVVSGLFRTISSGVAPLAPVAPPVSLGRRVALISPPRGAASAGAASATSRSNCRRAIGCVGLTMADGCGEEVGPLRLPSSRVQSRRPLPLAADTFAGLAVPASTAARGEICSSLPGAQQQSLVTSGSSNSIWASCLRLRLRLRLRLWLCVLDLHFP
jgi:hypothetical protein